MQIWLSVSNAHYSTIPLADLKGVPGGPNSIIFLQFLTINLQKISFWELAPPPDENLGSATEYQPFKSMPPTFFTKIKYQGA